MCPARIIRPSTVFTGAALILCSALALAQRPAPTDRRPVIPPAPDQAPIARGATPVAGPTLDATNTVADWSRYPRIARGEMKSGIWGDPDDLEWKYKYYDGYVYAGRAGEHLVVTAVSAYQPVLYVYAAGPTDSAGPSPSGRLIARAGGLSTNPRVGVLLPVDGEYLIVALSSYEDKSGDYTLAVESSQVVEVASGPRPRSSADIALTAQCEARNDRVQVTFACPSGWTRTEWRDEYDFRQVNYRHPADWHVAINARVHAFGVPNDVWGGGGEIYFNAGDFVRKTRVAYGQAADSSAEQVAGSTGAWRVFSLSATARFGLEGYGNLIPVDWMLETYTFGSTTYRRQRESFRGDNLAALAVDPTRGTRHAYGVAAFGNKLVVITLSGPPEVATDDLLRSVIESVRVSSNP